MPKQHGGHHDREFSKLIVTITKLGFKCEAKGATVRIFPPAGCQIGQYIAHPGRAAVKPVKSYVRKCGFTI